MPYHRYEEIGCRPIGATVSALSHRNQARAQALSCNRVPEVAMNRDNVIRFPRKMERRAPPPVETSAVIALPLWKRLVRGAFTIIWMMTVLCWPVLKWIIALDVTCRFLLMLFRWNIPESNAGWVFILHFLIFSALTFYVSCYKPSSFSR